LPVYLLGVGGPARSLVVAGAGCPVATVEPGP
jgi:hypothetical protein